VQVPVTRQTTYGMRWVVQQVQLPGKLHIIPATVKCTR